MTRTRVKICGITSVDDALDAISAGADAIGLVFYEPSPRHISIQTASEISKKIPPFINKVALFVDAEESYIKEVLNQVDIDLIQFHGQEVEQYCTLFDKPYIKAIRVRDDVDIKNHEQEYLSAKALLLDTYVKDSPGGSGQSFDWNLIPDDLSTPVILAGGLNSENVQQAIQQTKPYAVDVSGGVEREKGKKDKTKMINFIRAVSNV